MDRRNGFTLIEMAIVLAIVGVLLAVGVPAWRGMLVEGRAEAARGALLASLTQAATHAGLTGVEVVVCPSASGDCADQWDWSGGWIAYADRDGDRRADAGEPVLRRQAAIAPDLRLFTSKGRKRLVFQPNGGNVGSNVTFTLCRGDARPPRVLVLANHGRLRDGRSGKPHRALCAAGSW